jgi:CXXX repeat peptide maturase
MLKYIFVILDKSAPSFCYYQNPNKKSEIIEYQSLSEIILFAQKENIIINFLAGKEQIPKKHADLMKTVRHVVISPTEYSFNNEDIVVFDWNIESKSVISEKFDGANAILRIEKKYLSDLSFIINHFNSCKRLSIVLLDIEKYTETDFDIYRSQLNNIKYEYQQEYKNGSNKELNILSDRIVLTNMNNCDAGVVHLTFAPNGKFYICPAYYFENENNFIGDIKNGIHIKNKQLYALEYSPICRQCDAFQCKRCVYLNQKLTLEVNTPSRQQCIVSHLERNCSKDLFDNIKDLLPNLPNKEIVEIDYLDPFEKINNTSCTF